MNARPLALDLCSGLGGWAEGLEASGWDVIRVDIADMFAETGEAKPANCLLMLQDIRTFHGSQARQCGLIVASPPCTEYSWMAMPWSRAKQVGRALRGEDEFPANYRGSRAVEQLNELFDACFRIQREACEAAGRHIPMVVENVRGAIPWVGRSRWNFGSYHLWGDVPALMPIPAGKVAVKAPGLGRMGSPKRSSTYARARLPRLADRSEEDGRKVPGFRFDGSGRSFQSESVERHVEGRKLKTKTATSAIIRTLSDGRRPRTSSTAVHVRKAASAWDRQDTGSRLAVGSDAAISPPRRRGPQDDGRLQAEPCLALASQLACLADVARSADVTCLAESTRALLRRAAVLLSDGALGRQDETVEAVTRTSVSGGINP